MRLFPIALTLTISLSAATGAMATPLSAAPTGSWQLAAGIHPYTTQMTDQWVAAMNAADKAMADKAPADEMLKALEYTETLHAEKIQVLQRHPDYQTMLQRQLGIRLKLVKLYSNIGFMYAKEAARTTSAGPLTQPGGSYARYNQATALLKTYGAVKGESDPDFQKMTAYIAESRGQADSVAKQLGAVGGPGTSVVPQSSGTVDRGTAAYVAQWWELLDKLEASLSGTDAGAMARMYDTAEQHRKGWEGWMKKHSEYETIRTRQETLHGRIALKQVEADLAKAREMAAKGKQENNDNYFGANAGPAQQVGFARKHLETYAQLKGAGDPEVMRLTGLIEATAKDIETTRMAMKRAALAARKMPTDVYGGGDKGTLKASILAYWRQKYPQDKILGVRFFQAQWTRETNWKSNATSIYKSDYSWLAVKVIVQTDGEIATLYPAFANKQHQEGNRVIFTGDHSGGGYSVDEMLMKNVRF